MTTEQATQIASLRHQGVGYKRIGQMLDISPDTIKTYCRRHELGGAVAPQDVDSSCLNCHKPIIQVSGRKPKKFCCDKCRNAWWNTHLDLVKKKAIYNFVCQNCGKEFSVYGNANRKYCCHECYIEDRFGYKC